MAVCRGTKRNGEPCTLTANGGNGYCWAHDPSNAQERRRYASKAGRANGRGRPSTELTHVREENAAIRQRLLEGDLTPGVAAVAIQSLNCDVRCLDVALKAREQEELVQRLEALEGSLTARKAGSGYYA